MVLKEEILVQFQVVAEAVCSVWGDLSSPRPGKAIGSFDSRTKDFLPSGPREGEKGGEF